MRYPILGAALGASLMFIAVEVLCAPRVEIVEITFDMTEFHERYGLCA